MTDRYEEIRDALAKGSRPMTTEAVVEAVARAICVACEDNPDHQGDARGNEFRWQDYRDAALAAISATGACDPDTIRELLAERDALAKDAARYRCLSAMATQQADYLGPIFRIDVRRSEPYLFNFDAAVDAAIAAREGVRSE